MFDRMKFPFVNPTYLEHYPACEDFTGYFCKRCKQLIAAGLPSRNYCKECGFFAPKPDGCICQIIEEERF